LQQAQLQELEEWAAWTSVLLLWLGRRAKAPCKLRLSQPKVAGGKFVSGGRVKVSQTALRFNLFSPGDREATGRPGRGAFFGMIVGL
jgi:hypothetical protein